MAVAHVYRVRPHKETRHRRSRLTERDCSVLVACSRANRMYPINLRFHRNFLIHYLDERLCTKFHTLQKNNGLQKWLILRSAGPNSIVSAPRTAIVCLLPVITSITLRFYPVRYLQQSFHKHRKKRRVYCTLILSSLKDTVRTESDRFSAHPCI